jgi:hypothetical protein
MKENVERERVQLESQPAQDCCPQSKGGGKSHCLHCDISTMMAMGWFAMRGTRAAVPYMIDQLLQGCSAAQLITR